MKKKKMISVRMAEETLAKIDRIVERQRFLSRSVIINSIVDNILEILDEDELNKLILGHYAPVSDYKIIFRYVKNEHQ